jgi:hypothetical protein
MTGFPSRCLRRRAALVNSSPLHLSRVRSKSRNVAPIRDRLAHRPSTISAPLKNTRHPYPEPKRVVFVVNISTPLQVRKGLRPGIESSTDRGHMRTPDDEPPAENAGMNDANHDQPLNSEYPNAGQTQWCRVLLCPLRTEPRLHQRAQCVGRRYHPHRLPAIRESLRVSLPSCGKPLPRDD